VNLRRHLGDGAIDLITALGGFFVLIDVSAETFRQYQVAGQISGGPVLRTLAILTSLRFLGLI
jgi:hypothetical protein